MSPDAIVVGGGHIGLVVACYLATLPGAVVWGASGRNAARVALATTRSA